MTAHQRAARIGLRMLYRDGMVFRCNLRDGGVGGDKPLIVTSELRHTCAMSLIRDRRAPRYRRKLRPVSVYL